MEINRPTPAAKNLPGLIHESTRTAISSNRDAQTGDVSRALSTSKLLMQWAGGELRVRFEGNEVKLSGQQPARAGRRAL